MRHVLPALLIAMGLALPSVCVGQDASDVETKAYGSYAGGKFDTVDLATGNLFLDIPLISYQQRGKLPPLSFSVELNNAPYTRSVSCFPDQNDDDAIVCATVYYRYDTTAPGSLSWAYGHFSNGMPNLPGTGKIGAAITSSYEGPIVSGTVVPSGNNLYDSLQYSLIDPAGKTHALESGADNLNLYHAQDGSGWTFLPAGPGNAYDYSDEENQSFGIPTWPSAQYWLNTVANSVTGSGVRLGSVLSPNGVKYTSQIVEEPQLTRSYMSGTGPYSIAKNLLSSAATDPFGNSVTRGPWYWADAGGGLQVSDLQTFYSNPSNQPLYVDSIGRSIPDIVSLQEIAQGSSGSNSGQCPVGTTSLTWDTPGPGTNLLTYIFCYTQMTLGQAFNALYNTQLTPNTASMNMLTSIILPNGTQWTFTYNALTSNLVKVGLPTGGSVAYTYELMPDDRCAQNLCEAVQTRSEDDGFGHISTDTYSYNVFRSQPTGPQFVTYYTTTETDSMQNDTVHTFNLVGSTVGGFTTSQLFETKTQSYQRLSSASTPQLLKTVATNYEYQWDVPAAGSAFRAIDVLPTQIVTSFPNQRSTEVTRQYSSASGAPLFAARRLTCPNTGGGVDDPTRCQDLLASSSFPANSSGLKTDAPNISYVEPTLETTYSGSPQNPAATVVQSSTIQYEFEVDGRYKSANMISLPQSQQESGAYAQTTTVYGYDEANGSPQGILGDVTSKTTSSYMNYAASPTFTTSDGTVYNSNGMPAATIDANGNRTSVTYDSTGLFTSSIQRPTTSGIQHVDYYSYDQNLGFLNWHTDENGSAAGDENHTTIYSHDLMGRVTSIQFPGGGGSSFCYTDLGGSACAQSGPPYKLFTNTTASPDPSVLTMHTYDGLGRSIQSSVLSDPLGADIVDTTYDLEGRVQSVSNPYRVSSTTPDPTVGITSYTFDAFGRKTIQIQPDGTQLQWCYDGLATTGQTNCSGLATRGAGVLGQVAHWTDVSDEKGNHVQQSSDALDHLIAVVEPSASTGALDLETDYTYDVFGDLLTVNQLGSSGSTPRTRRFSYFAPSLVENACNPEVLSPGQNCNGFNGIWYSYDADGNLLQKLDNRGVTSTYSYDGLNRLLSKTYSDLATPISCYQYDTLGAANNGRGRLAAAWTQSASTGACSASAAFWTKRTMLSYDSMGRLLTEQQCTPSTCRNGSPYAPSYTYDLAGKLLTSTNGYGSTPTVGTLQFTSTYDGAGHLQTLASNWNDGSHPAALFAAQAGSATPCSNSTVPYSPFGGLINATFGTGLTLNRSYDSRLRTICEVDTGSGSGGSPVATSGFTTIQITGKEQGK